MGFYSINYEYFETTSGTSKWCIKEKIKSSAQNIWGKTSENLIVFKCTAPTLLQVHKTVPIVST